MKKDNMMKSKFAIVALGALLAGCNGKTDEIHAGLSATHVPVVTQANYVFDADTPGGFMSAAEMQRLSDWMSTLGVDYGDHVYVDGSANSARGQVAAVAGQFGIIPNDGAPITSGLVNANVTRVVVSRAEAHVPGCPDWSGMSEPDYVNNSTSNYGCGVSSALAMQVANAEDLVHGHAGPAAEDGESGAKAINMYRTWPLTGVTDGQGKRPLKRSESYTTKEK